MRNHDPCVLRETLYSFYVILILVSKEPAGLGHIEPSSHMTKREMQKSGSPEAEAKMRILVQVTYQGYSFRVEGVKGEKGNETSEYTQPGSSIRLIMGSLGD